MFKQVTKDFLVCGLLDFATRNSQSCCTYICRVIIIIVKFFVYATSLHNAGYIFIVLEHTHSVLMRR